MFKEKERHWINGPYYTTCYDNWQQWLINRPYTNATWSLFYPLLWNIKDLDKDHLVQILYMKPDGIIDIKETHITVQAEDEPLIREWFNQQKWIHML